MECPIGRPEGWRSHQITARSRGISMRQRLTELRRYCVGWFHYCLLAALGECRRFAPRYKYGLPYNEVLHWDQWIRRRVRLCYWKDWKVPRKRRRMLIKLGVAKDQVKKASRSRKGYWSRVAGSRNSLVNLALSGRYLEEQGVPSMRALWVTFKYRDKAQL
jgi:RNA-directed DNA polymerase